MRCRLFSTLRECGCFLGWRHEVFSGVVKRMYQGLNSIGTKNSKLNTIPGAPNNVAEIQDIVLDHI